MFTILTTAKDFDSNFKLIQVNAINSWRSLSEDIEIIIFGASKGVNEYSKIINATYIPKIKCTDSGIPLISDMIFQGTRRAKYDLLLLINADIILPNNFLDIIQILKNRKKKFLAIGHRWDMDVDEYINFNNPTETKNFWSLSIEVSKQHSCTGIDYFIFKKGTLKSLPDFAIGRFGWDNWILWYVRRRLIPLIDLSAEIKVIHQNHIYKKHFKTDIDKNVKLGEEKGLNILDSNYLFKNGRITRNVSKSFINRNLGKLPKIFPEISIFLVLYKKIYKKFII
tara:strand:- start:8469 stop:9314 length:846 start_codon:yes stop_codon:yes gene_type:complete